jgi:capsular polysaccharide biosynthesis protein
VNDPDQTVTWLPGAGDDLQERLWAYEDPELNDRPAVDPATGLVSLGFIGGALRRSARLWCTFAVIGLLIGGAWYVANPPAHKASVSVLLVDNPSQNPAVEVQTDTALAQSTPVAAGVVSQLGLQEPPSTFLGTYSITVETDQVLLITVSAPTSDEAVRRASAVATQFLKFRAQYAETQQQQTEAQLDQQISQAQQQLETIAGQISQLSSQPNTTEQHAELTSLRAQRDAASNNLAQVRSYVTDTLASSRTLTQAMVQGSEVLNNAAPVKRSLVKGGVLYAIGGLVGGLVIGLAIAVVGAVTSDRLRRRDDIAAAFGAPVRLSVGRLRQGRWLPPLLRRKARRRDMERVVEHLRTAVPGSSRGPVGLAVVAVDDARTVARAVVELAVSSANKQRMRVVLADLSAGAYAARSLRADIPGISTVSSGGKTIVVVVPAADDVAPVGPLKSAHSPEGYRQADESLAVACASADLVLTLVTLDPAFGGDHLATWATDVVAIVTAGRSTAVRIRAVGEMVRLAETRLGSVVVIDADKGDESLGAMSPSYEPASR